LLVEVVQLTEEVEETVVERAKVAAAVLAGEHERYLRRGVRLAGPLRGAAGIVRRRSFDE
jgi:hypothetical protein